jgi:hypothetical protein
VLARGGLPPREAKARNQPLVATMEGRPLLACIRRSTKPILDIASA